MDRWADATAALSAADPAMAAAIARHGPCTLARRRVAGGAFGALARAICFQQLAGAAASTIHGRFLLLFDGTPTPAAVLATSDEALAGVGLSRAKAAAIRDLAARSLDGTVRLRGWDRLTDEEIVEHLVAVRGIGPWTAQMFLMFDLNRPDVWPVGDLGVRAGYARIHGLAVPPTEQELVTLGDRYRPWRSIAAWYCWRAMDTRTVEPPPRQA